MRGGAICNALHKDTVDMCNKRCFKCGLNLLFRIFTSQKCIDNIYSQSYSIYHLQVCLCKFVYKLLTTFSFFLTLQYTVFNLSALDTKHGTLGQTQFIDEFLAYAFQPNGPFLSYFQTGDCFNLQTRIFKGFNTPRRLWSCETNVWLRLQAQSVTV